MRVLFLYVVKIYSLDNRKFKNYKLRNNEKRQLKLEVGLIIWIKIIKMGDYSQLL